jgi:hypothetical protein
VPQLTKRRWLVVLPGLLSALALVILGRWLNATKRGGQAPAEPFRIAGNFYYVGANDVAAFLITGPEGHVVLDGGYPTTASMIMASIAKLGFGIKDVKVLLNSEPEMSHKSTDATVGVTGRCQSPHIAADPGKSGSAVPRLGRLRPTVDACFGTACKFLQSES